MYWGGGPLTVSEAPVRVRVLRGTQQHQLPFLPLCSRKEKDTQTCSGEHCRLPPTHTPKRVEDRPHLRILPPIQANLPLNVSILIIPGKTIFCYQIWSRMGSLFFLPHYIMGLLCLPPVRVLIFREGQNTSSLRPEGNSHLSRVTQKVSLTQSVSESVLRAWPAPRPGGRETHLLPR